jgi:AAHS family 4-hydroxybenzoate transporter-like MFS transporter
MDSIQTIDVTQVIEEQKRGSFIVTLVLLTTLMMIFDGYDQLAIAVGAPSIIRAWAVDRASFGIVFGIGMAGTVFGGLALGFLGDRIGRKGAIITGLTLFGVFTLLIAFSTSIEQLVVLRFIAGIGLGGLFPLGVSLSIEFAPKRLRATIVTITMLGYTGGGMLGGLTAAWLIPHYGWQIVFWIGGLVPLAAAGLLLLLLPESIRWLVARKRGADKIARIVQRIAPGLQIPPGAEFIVSDEANATKGKQRSSFVRMFKGRLRWMTPLLWIGFTANSLATAFQGNWTPTLAEAAGITPTNAVLASTVLQLGGAIGGLVLAHFVDRYGAIALAIMPLAGAPLVALLGVAGFSDTAYLAVMFAVGFFIIGGQLGFYAVTGMLYPSDYRASASGWTASVSKCGVVAGAAIGGVLLGIHLGLPAIYLVMTIPSIVTLACVVPLGLLHRRQMSEETADVIRPQPGIVPAKT